MPSLQDKVVFITGASAGIGAALARACAASGAHVALTARRAERLRALADEIKAGGRSALALAADVTRDGDLEVAAQAAVAELGRIDVVIANAGFSVAGNVDKLTLADFRSQFETNVFGVLRTIYATLPALKASRGVLALVGSVSGYINPPGVGAYNMSKAALISLAETLRLELAPHGVAVTLISPGFVASEIRKVDNEGVYQEGRKDPAPPWLVMPAAQAAQQVVHAIVGRRREAVITWHGKLAAALGRHTPGLRGLILKRAARRVLPE